MKYLIGGVLSVFASILAACIVYCTYMTFTDDPYWSIVAVGLTCTFIVVMLAITAAFDAVKGW